ncbi:hypothetical protein NIBR502772_02570 [Pseudarthrobacter sp. NIBRBAC000502772]|uniref:hypothetical protein n=1 Tax=Pseudarthrobacter sp. NIBRBAC000502772 TaxID=2590775 RepID=UPI001130B976|nr:hypothetical protein [Pseudarthrobacter sp. NIBRBAC000502772]QDG65242.1 hypothetical protein NIBR502772_02570 [Pseudarthrobacter sp. NIBRBAC000502772]
MKSILSAAFGLATSLVLAGCASGAPQASTTTSPTPTKSASASPKPSPTKTVTPTPTPTPSGLRYSLSCRTGSDAPSVAITNYRTAWAQPFDSCTVSSAAGNPSPEEKAAGTASGSTSPDGAKYLYSICSETTGHYFGGTVSEGQAKEIAAALMLCPDHPKRAALEASAGAGVSLEADRANGKLVYSGKYLVGKTAQPGTWQSQGESVEDCYWEVSDAQGNILANNFISIAPQFTIYVPATAAGFTVEGCGFRWIGG